MLPRFRFRQYIPVSGKQCGKRGLIKNLNTQFLCLFQLGTRIFSNNQQIELARNTTHYFGPSLFSQLLSL